VSAAGEVRRVSAVVPVRNEARHIEGCLRRLFEQTYPPDHLEIVVVDGLSEDGTREIVERLIATRQAGGGGTEAGPAMRLVEDPRRRRPSAVNAGIRAARGDVIARIDARAVVPPDYLERCVRALDATGADNVGGLQKPVASGAVQEAIGLAMSHPFGVGNAQFRIGKRSGFVDSVYLGCFRREVFDRIGLFDEDAPLLSEDSDINERIRASGGRVYLDAGIVVHYYPRESLPALWKMYVRYGGARAGNLLKHRGLTSWRQAVPPAFVATLVVLAVLSFVSRWSLLALAAVLAAYAACAVVAAGAACAAARRWSLWPLVAAAFPCIHVAWGSGVLFRLLRPRGADAVWTWTER